MLYKTVLSTLGVFLLLACPALAADTSIVVRTNQATAVVKANGYQSPKVGHTHIFTWRNLSVPAMRVHLTASWSGQHLSEYVTLRCGERRIHTFEFKTPPKPVPKDPPPSLPPPDIDVFLDYDADVDSEARAFSSSHPRQGQTQQQNLTIHPAPVIIPPHVETPQPEPREPICYRTPPSYWYCAPNFWIVMGVLVVGGLMLLCTYWNHKDMKCVTYTIANMRCCPAPSRPPRGSASLRCEELQPR